MVIFAILDYNIYRLSEEEIVLYKNIRKYSTFKETKILKKIRRFEKLLGKYDG